MVLRHIGHVFDSNNLFVQLIHVATWKHGISTVLILFSIHILHVNSLSSDIVSSSRPSMVDQSLTDIVLSLIVSKIDRYGTDSVGNKYRPGTSSAGSLYPSGTCGVGS